MCLSALEDADYGALGAVVHLRLGETLRVLGHYPGPRGTTAVPWPLPVT